MTLEGIRWFVEESSGSGSLLCWYSSEAKVPSPLAFWEDAVPHVYALGDPMVTVAPTTQIPNQTSFLSILQRLELQTSTSMQKSWWQLTLKKKMQRKLCILPCLWLSPCHLIAHRDILETLLALLVSKFCSQPSVGWALELFFRQENN